VTPSGQPVLLRGADTVARGAVAASARSGQSRLALVDDSVGIVFAPAGRLQVVLALQVSPGRRITAIDVIGDPGRLRRLRLALLPD
jgi:RNA polymerase sigma-70 factor (ECF subfamily)